MTKIVDHHHAQRCHRGAAIHTCKDDLTSGSRLFGALRRSRRRLQRATLCGASVANPNLLPIQTSFTIESDPGKTTFRACLVNFQARRRRRPQKALALATYIYMQCTLSMRQQDDPAASALGTAPEPEEDPRARGCQFRFLMFSILL